MLVFVVFSLATSPRLWLSSNVIAIKEQKQRKKTPFGPQAQNQFTYNLKVPRFKIS